MTISGSVGDAGSSWSTLKLCPSCGLRPRVEAESGTAVAQEQEDFEFWGWDGERGMWGWGVEGLLITFVRSGDFLSLDVCDVDVVSTLEDRRRSSPRLISVADMIVFRFGDLVLKRRLKKLPPLAPWWYPDLRGLFAARNDLCWHTFWK